LQIKSGIAIDRQVLRPHIIGVIKKFGLGHTLTEEGGTFAVSVTWVGDLLHAMNLANRKGTTAAQKLPSDWEEQAKLCALR
jgi:hypothetical protein